MPKVLLTRQYPALAHELLAAAGLDVIVWPEPRPMTPEELVEQSKKADALLCTITDKITPEFLRQCPHIKVLAQFGVGYDNINVPEATKYGVAVGNTPGVLTDATADTAFALLLCVSRKVLHNHKKILAGGWKSFEPDKSLGIELKGKTLGILGLGRIGMEMARRCKGAYSMNILYHNRSKNSSAEKELGARLVSFDELLGESDIVSAHCALTAGTRGIFNKDAFAKMKQTAIFINTARGPVHNEEDLHEALVSKKIWGAGLDVTNPEPMSFDNPLLSMENVAIFPHIGSATEEARNGMARLAAENIIGYFKDGVVPNNVNPDYKNFKS
ncbi:MAG TPA: D-glycerate dehydrogenase [Cyclobacteriaceae bacterium]|nr:D-glycerate dehydrogenase [Cyclobacteriaceae bacterium]